MGCLEVRNSTQYHVDQYFPSEMSLFLHRLTFRQFVDKLGSLEPDYYISEEELAERFKLDKFGKEIKSKITSRVKLFLKSPFFRSESGFDKMKLLCLGFLLTQEHYDDKCHTLFITLQNNHNISHMAIHTIFLYLLTIGQIVVPSFALSSSYNHRLKQYQRLIAKMADEALIHITQQKDEIVTEERFVSCLKGPLKYFRSGSRIRSQIKEELKQYIY